MRAIDDAESRPCAFANGASQRGIRHRPRNCARAGLIARAWPYTRFVESLTGGPAILDVGGVIPIARAVGFRARSRTCNDRQLRAKTLPVGSFRVGAKMREIATAGAMRLIIDDRADIALASGTTAYTSGRAISHQSVERGNSPAHDRCFLPQRGRCRARRGFGAVDYVGLGPIFPTRSKTNPDPVVGLSQLAETCARHSDLAVVAIGGIELTSLASIRNAQARGAAMIGALFREGVDPGDAFSEATPRWRAAS